MLIRLHQMVIMRIVSLHLAEDNMSVDGCEAQISQLLLLVLLVGHLVFHVIGKDAHGLFTHLTMFELSVTLTNFTHFCTDDILLHFLLISHSILLFFSSQCMALYNCHLLHWLFFLLCILF